MTLIDSFTATILTMVLPLVAHSFYLMGSRGQPLIGLIGLVPVVLVWMYASIAMTQGGLLGAGSATGLSLFIGLIGVVMWIGLSRLARMAAVGPAWLLQVPIAAVFLIFGYFFVTTHFLAEAGSGALL